MESPECAYLCSIQFSEFQRIKRNMFYFAHFGLGLLFALLPTAWNMVTSNGLGTRESRDILNFKELKKPITFAQPVKTTNLTVPLQIKCFYNPSYVEIDVDDCEKAFFDVFNREDFLEPYTFGPDGSYRGQLSWKKDRCEMAILPPTSKTTVPITLAKLARYGLNVITRCRAEKMEFDLLNTGEQVVVPQTMGLPTQNRHLMVQIKNV